MIPLYVNSSFHYYLENHGHNRVFSPREHDDAIPIGAIAAVRAKAPLPQTARVDSLLTQGLDTLMEGVFGNALIFDPPMCPRWIEVKAPWAKSATSRSVSASTPSPTPPPARLTGDCFFRAAGMTRLPTPTTSAPGSVGAGPGPGFPMTSDTSPRPSWPWR